MRMTLEKHIAAVLVATWSLWAVPVFCVAGVMGPHCGCDCPTDCGDDEDCFLDPCRVVAVRAELRCDESQFVTWVAHGPVHPDLTAPGAAAFGVVSTSHSPPDVPALPYAPSDRPLLI